MWSASRALNEVAGEKERMREIKGVGMRMLELVAVALAPGLGLGWG